MATVSYRGSLRNNEKRFRQAMVATVKETMPGGNTITAGDTIEIGVIPPNSYVVGAYANVKTQSATALSTAVIKMGSTTIFSALAIDATGITESSVVDATHVAMTTGSNVVSVTPTKADIEIELVIEYVEASARTGMYAEEQ